MVFNILNTIQKFKVILLLLLCQVRKQNKRKLLWMEKVAWTRVSLVKSA